MVVSAGGKESRGVSQALHYVETEHAVIEIDRAFQIGDLQMHVSDADACVYGHISN
jgi:hypothetical protein